MFSASPAQAATTTSPLHTSGTSILDANGNVVYLRGIGIAGMAPDLILWGNGGSDNWGDQWNYNPTTVMDQTFQALQISMARQHDTSLHLPKLVLPRQHHSITRRLQLIINNTNKHQNILANTMQRSRQIRNLRRHSPIHANTINQLIWIRPLRHHQLWMARTTNDEMGHAPAQTSLAQQATATTNKASGNGSGPTWQTT